ncbi:transglutaminase domain-containing protein [Flavobacterium macrobrachii]|uniref:transglutaminase domain-containing protein n=1 Tax=Flavobacterium macrobrachii TaxID=591204 RepID=UPI003F727D0C
MNLKKRFLFFLLPFFLISHGQKHDLGKVTKEELLEKLHKDDTSAVAAFKFKKAKTTFNYSKNNGFVSSTEFFIKIKIYKKEGTSWGNFDIPYYIGYENLNKEQIEILSAYTYNLENNQIIKEKVESQSKFKKVINEYWAKKTIAFPNVKEGSIIELRYKFKSENLSILPEFQFQYEIPVDYAEFQTAIPEFYLYKGIKSGYKDIAVEQKMDRGSQSYDNEHKQTVSFSYNQINSIYKASNVKAIKNEAYTSNIENFYGKINHELETIRMPNETPKQISTTWEAVVMSIYKDEKFGKEIKEYDYFLHDLKLVLGNKSEPIDKINTIFNYIKSNMNWNENYGYYAKKGVKKVYQEKSGNAAEINFILLSMLKMAGIEAYPVLISTRENSVANFPNKSTFNYVIVAVKEQGKTLLLDATDKNATINILPIRCLNWIGRLIQDDGTSTEINLMPEKNSLSAINMMAEVSENGDVNGKVRKQYFDYNAYIYRDKNNGVSTESLIERTERQFAGVEVSDYATQNNTDLTLPIVENYTFSSDNLVETIGNTMYISPLLFFTTTENPFKQETREYPVDFVYPHQDKYNISLTIPDGYTIETLPSTKGMALPDGLGKFSYNISKNNNQVQLLYSLDINQAIISPEYYEALKNFYKEIVTKQTEKIVLKKG